MVADPELLQFLCPLCGSYVALYVYVLGRGGEPFRLPAYQCAGCTVQFGDIRRFKRLLRHTYDSDLRRVDEKPSLGADERPLPSWSPAAQLKK